jgi:hypothetical protein
MKQNMLLYSNLFEIILDFSNNEYASTKTLFQRYDKFRFERLSSHMRGLPKVDQIKELEKTAEESVIQTSAPMLAVAAQQEEEKPLSERGMPRVGGYSRI